VIVKKGFTMFTRIKAYDLVFVLTAIAFNLLIAGILIAQKKRVG